MSGTETKHWTGLRILYQSLNKGIPMIRVLSRRIVLRHGRDIAVFKTQIRLRSATIARICGKKQKQIKEGCVDSTTEPLLVSRPFSYVAHIRVFPVSKKISCPWFCASHGPEKHSTQDMTRCQVALVGLFKP